MVTEDRGGEGRRVPEDSSVPRTSPPSRASTTTHAEVESSPRGSSLRSGGDIPVRDESIERRRRRRRQRGRGVSEGFARLSRLRRCDGRPNGGEARTRSARGFGAAPLTQGGGGGRKEDNATSRGGRGKNKYLRRRALADQGRVVGKGRTNERVAEGVLFEGGGCDGVVEGAPGGDPGGLDGRRSAPGKEAVTRRIHTRGEEFPEDQYLIWRLSQL
mmetsp:Transcript_28607/g.84267  ORF Transcript_28607/g.84267 Transcript_28607/m.84267 type:complete len:216 (-) Transcript_28607:888-1535(-)